MRTPDAASKHWSAECGTDWLKVRGPNYLRDRRKQAPAPAVAECVKVTSSFDDGPCANGERRRADQQAAPPRTDATSDGEPWTFVFSS